MSLLQNSNAISAAGGYTIERSLRFRSSAAARLSRTFATPTSSTTWTVSLWFKRGEISSAHSSLFVTSVTDNFIRFQTGTDILQYSWANGSTVQSTAVFRDPSAWYHLVIAVDTTQATSSNRIRIYINGSEIAYGTSSYPALNATTLFNTARAHYLSFTSNQFDGYVAEVNWIDGQQLTPSSFGAANADTGVWRPKAYTGTYGTNGFYLPFTDNSALTTASNVGLGKDFSGNGNYWTTTNISITSGETYDSMTDVPTLTSATAANFATINPIYVTASTETNIKNANLTADTTGQTASSTGCVCSTPLDSGKWYWEVNVATLGATMQIGVIPTNMTTSLGKSNTGIYCYHSTGTKYVNGVNSSYGASYTAGDVIGMTYDSSTGVLTAYKNNTSQGTLTTLATTSSFTPYLGFDNGGAQIAHINFGQRPFTYTPPTGFLALNTYNLSDSTIKEGDLYMDATLYTGTGSSLSVTNAAGFRPDLVWIKSRSGATDNVLYDAVRGATLQLVTNSQGSDTTESQGLTAFNSNGFTVGTLGALNTNAATYVGWQWQAGSSTVTNTSGTISAQVRANTTTGFSIVSYTGTGANATVGHGLGVAPKMIIVKRVSGAGVDWAVYHASLANTQYLALNTTAAVATGTTWWNSTSPTSTVFSVGTSASTGNAQDFIAYCWAEIEGFSRFGSYTGNGNANGPFVYTGFRPKFVIFKNSTTATTAWKIADTSRSTYNVAAQDLEPSSSNNEVTGTSTTNLFVDLLSNGFKLRGTAGALNTNAATIVYAAFAENPFKNSLAR